MIHLNNVSFRYENTDLQSIQNINLHVSQGECILLCGESGCGKTTVTRLINGLIPHFYEGELKGEVYVQGMPASVTPLDTLSRHVGSVFQNPKSQFFCVDTTGEIAFGAENMQLPKEEILQRISRTAEQLEIQNLLNRNIFHLSGGEKQKIACAGVHVTGADLIVLDEPTSNLDAEGIEMLERILSCWKSEGKTIVIAEHRLYWMERIADRVLYMEHGSVTASWTGSEFFRKESEELHALGLRDLKKRENYLNLEKGLHRISLEEEPHVPYYLLEDFHYAYRKGEQALTLASMKIPKHAVTAVIGENGAGKSTFSRCLCGIQKGFKGKVTSSEKNYKGKKLINLSYMVMQDVNHQLFTDTVLEEVTLGLKEESEEAGEEILKRMDLYSVRDRHPMSLSGGQKQRTAICSAYLSSREILVFDEPTSGLDYRHMQETAELIREISREKTVFIVTHDMELVESCCTHILKIQKA